MSLLDRTDVVDVPAPEVTSPGTTTRRRPAIDAGFLARQGALLLVAAGIYFGVRHLTVGEAEAARANAHLLVDVERRLGIFHELALQRVALDVDGLTPIINGIYVWGHWPVIAAVLGWLAWRRRSAFLVYRNALLLSGLVGMLIVALFPVAPPRLLDLGFVDTVVTHTDAYRVLQPPSFTNQYAAMPSFHAGWDLLVGIALVREARTPWVRAAGLLLPWAMVASVVLSGNHFIVDVVVGDAIVLVSLSLVRRLAGATGRVLPQPRATAIGGEGAVPAGGRRDEGMGRGSTGTDLGRPAAARGASRPRAGGPGGAGAGGGVRGVPDGSAPGRGRPGPAPAGDRAGARGGGPGGRGRLAVPSAGGG